MSLKGVKQKITSPITRAPLIKIAEQLKNLVASEKDVIGHEHGVSRSILKWSYGDTESNLSLAHVFSCLADLDYAHTQLIYQLGEKHLTYRQIFKYIHEREEDLKKFQNEKEKAAKKVKTLHQKVETLKNSKKPDPDKMNAAGTELSEGIKKLEEADNLLKVKTIEFENFKAKTLRDAVISYSSGYLDILADIQMIFQTKKEIGEMMSETPVYNRGDLQNEPSKVEDVYNRLHLELPMREHGHDRLQLNRRIPASPSPVSSVSTLPSNFPFGHPPTPSNISSHSFHEDEDDADDYTTIPDMPDNPDDPRFPPSFVSDYVTPIPELSVTPSYINTEIEDNQSEHEETRLPPGISTPPSRPCPVLHPTPTPRKVMYPMVKQVDNLTLEQSSTTKGSQNAPAVSPKPRKPLVEEKSHTIQGSQNAPAVSTKPKRPVVDEQSFTTQGLQNAPAVSSKPKRPVAKPRVPSTIASTERQNENELFDSDVYVFHQVSGTDPTNET